MFYLPRICNHCTYPACLGSCPRQVIYRRPEDGIVLVDQTRCRGYRECVRGCPYKKTFFNPLTRVSAKCIGCYPAVENGRQTQCTITCIGKIRLQGFISPPDAMREDNPIDYLVHVAKLAHPPYPQFGLEPNVYFIPPVHVPPAFLRQMFGPGSVKAVETYRAAKNDKTMLAALLLFGANRDIVSRFRVEGDYSVGFSEAGAELVRLPLREPTYVRETYDEKHQTHRSNIT